MPPRARRSEYVRFSEQLADSLEQITETIKANGEMIDAIQEIALQLTTTFGNLHALTLKYATMVNNVLDTILPVIDKVPFISDKIVDLLKDMERLTQKIIDGSDETQQVLSDVQEGLTQADIQRLKKHMGDLKSVTRKIEAVIPDRK